MSIDYKGKTELDSKELERESKEIVEQKDELIELSEKFNEDKNKLEDAIERVERSNISEADKRAMIAELEAAISELQEQYENDVTAATEKLDEDMENQLESMDEAIDELEEQSEALDSITMEAANTDASAAAAEADEKKDEFIRIKNDYTEQYKLQQEQAAMLQRMIRVKKITGR